MDIEGIPLRAWSRETFKKIRKKRGETMDLEDNDNVTSESRPSLSHPPGFTPEGVMHHEILGTVNGEADNNGGKDYPVPVSTRVMNTSQDISEEMHSDSVGSKTIHNGGSMLGVMEDFIRIGQAMGYAMEGSVNDLATIIGQQGDDNVIR
nr:RNA-directed DNA polymerase, eukaryota [Tanacetum cinerariifolium]